MQTVTQSYGTHTYTQIQGISSLRNSDNPEYSSRLSADSSNPSKPDDSVTLSPKGIQLSQKKDRSVVSADEKGNDQKPLSQEELRLLTELKLRDTEVRTHEQAHLSAAGGATFSYTTGPNGKRYASGGKVPIDMSKEDSPEATILKMRTVRRAALAPTGPSSADRAIAFQASAKEVQAMKELQDQETLMAIQPSSSSSNAETPEGNKDDAQPSSAPDISGNSRAIMASAYQTMAALGS